MTKVRTVIPVNAKPGVSIIQVSHPKSGNPTRVVVPKNAIPGQMVELELPDEGALLQSRGRNSPLTTPNEKRGAPSRSASSASADSKRSDVLRATGPPVQNSINSNVVTKPLAKEDEPLIGKPSNGSQQSRFCPCAGERGILCCF